MNHLRVCGDMKMSVSISYMNYLLIILWGPSEVHTNTNILLNVYTNTSLENTCNYHLKNKLHNLTN